MEGSPQTITTWISQDFLWKWIYSGDSSVECLKYTILEATVHGLASQLKFHIRLFSKFTLLQGISATENYITAQISPSLPQHSILCIYHTKYLYI